MQTESFEPLNIRPVTEVDIPLVLEFIRDIAEYERLLDQVVADEAILRESFFGPRAKAEGLIAERAGEPAAFAIYFENFSTFTGRPGLYLEDLFVKPAWRQHGIGRANRNAENTESAALCWCGWRKLLWNAVARASNGWHWIGTRMPLISTKNWGPNSSTTGESSEWKVKVLPSWPRKLLTINH